MSLLGPLLMGGLIAGYIYLAMNQGDTLSVVRVVDETGKLSGKLTNSKSVVFNIDTMPIETARHLFNPNTEYAVLDFAGQYIVIISSARVVYREQPNLMVVGYIEGELQKEIESMKLTGRHSTINVLFIKTDISLQQKPVDPNGKDKEFSAGLTAGIGFGAGLFILPLFSCMAYR